MLRKWSDLPLSAEVKEVMLSSWKPNSRAQYKTYIKQWEHYCQQNLLNPNTTTLKIGTEFLHTLFNKGLGYSAINTASSALSAILTPIDGLDFGKHPVIKKFLTGVFKIRPSIPKYICTFNVERVLRFLKSLPTWEQITLKQQTKKFATLLAILTTQRCQTINVLHLDKMDLEPERVIFYIPEPLKNTTQNFHAAPIRLSAYPEDESICPVRNTVEYIKATHNLRKTCRKLIISFHNHTEVTTQTVRRYVVDTLEEAGINVQVFRAHSTRSASSSYNQTKGVPLKDIISAGGWKNSNTFQKHYNLPIVE